MPGERSARTHKTETPGMARRYRYAL